MDVDEKKIDDPKINCELTDSSYIRIPIRLFTRLN